MGAPWNSFKYLMMKLLIRFSLDLLSCLGIFTLVIASNNTTFVMAECDLGLRNLLNL